MTSTRALRFGLLAFWALAALSAAQTKTPYYPDNVVSIKPEDLPEPYATKSAMNPPRVVTAPDGATFEAPPGFKVSLLVAGFQTPRIVETRPNGDVFIVESTGQRVTRLRDSAGDKTFLQRDIVVDDLDLPFGIAFTPTHLYVANTSSVVRVPYTDDGPLPDGEPEVILPNLPGRGYNQHWTRNLQLDPTGEWLYISVGSQSNVSPEEPRRAAVLRCKLDGSNVEIVASGLRNPVGLRFNPTSGALWSAVNERDGLGDDLVPDYFTSVEHGAHYGWPYCWVGRVRDPRVLGGEDIVARAKDPDLLIQAHSAALGFAFVGGDMFPDEMRGDAVIALHGSWNRSALTGYCLIRVPFDDEGKPLGWYEPFVRGFLNDPADRRVWGRPMGVAMHPDGSMLMTDDGGMKLWRITYEASAKP